MNITLIVTSFNMADLTADSSSHGVHSIVIVLYDFN